jgi:hypothetical protein
VDQATADVRPWLDLYRAVAARDATNMAKAGETLLRTDGAMDPGRRQYALVAAMLGRLVNDQPAQVVQLWEAERAVAEDVNSLPDVRLLLSMALDRRAESARSSR